MLILVPYYLNFLTINYLSASAIQEKRVQNMFQSNINIVDLKDIELRHFLTTVQHKNMLFC